MLKLEKVSGAQFFLIKLTPLVQIEIFGSPQTHLSIQIVLWNISSLMTNFLCVEYLFDAPQQKRCIDIKSIDENVPASATKVSGCICKSEINVNETRLLKFWSIAWRILNTNDAYYPETKKFAFNWTVYLIQHKCIKFVTWYGNLW